jgi:amino acid transporter
MHAPPRQSVLVLTAISAGLAFASSCFPLLALTVAKLGPWALAAIGASGVLVWLVSRTYAELAGIYPTSAGVRTYVGQAFGDGRGLWLALLYLFLLVALGASESTIASQVLHAVFPDLAPLPVCLGFIALCAVTNILGIEPAGKLQVVLTLGLLAGLAGLGLVAIGRGGAPPLERAELAGLDPLATGLAGATFLFVGFEWVVSAVEEVDPRGRALPKAMSISIASLAVVYGLLALAFWLGLGRDALAGGVTPHLALGGGIGRAGLYLMAALSITATVTAFNGGILGASRLAYALAREGVLPRPLATLSPRFLTPWVAILTMSLLTGASALGLATTQAYKVPILVGAAIECFVYAAVALAFAELRTTQPERGRPFRAPFGRGVARFLALVFAGLAIACVSAAGEWALASGVTLVAAGALTGGAAYRAVRARAARSVAPTRRPVAARAREVVSHG